MTVCGKAARNPPTFFADFITTPSLPAGLTHTRAGGAMMFDSTGRLTWAHENIVLQSQAFNNWTRADIDAFGSGSVVDAIVAPDGTITADFIRPSANFAQHYMRQDLTSGSVPAIISAYVYAGGYSKVMLFAVGTANVGYGFDLTGDGATSVVTGITAADNPTIEKLGVNGWYRISIKVANLTNFRLQVLSAFNTFSFTGDGVSGIYAWGVQVERVTYQTIPKAYNPTTSAAYYEPRFDYNPATLEPRGYLNEESRKNWLVKSNLFNDGLWSKQGLSFANTDGTISPDGTANAYKIVAGETTGEHRIYQSYGSSPLTTVISLYAKKGTVNFLCLSGGTTTVGYAVFNLDTGTIVLSGGSVLSYGIEAIGNGWYRCWIYFSGQYLVANLGDTIAHATSQATWTGTGTESIYIFGGQFEPASSGGPTSYIPNDTVKVTRAADVITGNIANMGWNADEGTLIVEGDLLILNQFGPIASFNKGSSFFYNSAFELWQSNISVSAIGNLLTAHIHDSAGGVTVISSAVAIPIGTIFRTGVSQKQSDSANGFIILVNGATKVTGIPRNLSGTIAFTLGYRGDNRWFTGHIRSFAYYNRSISDNDFRIKTAIGANY